MKKILYIFLTLSIVSVGCSNNQTKELNNSSSLDPKLYGIWKDDILNQHYRSYSSNGKFVYWETSEISSFKFVKECGSWWVQDGILFEKYYSSLSKSGYSTNVRSYSISGNTFNREGDSWIKQ